MPSEEPSTDPPSEEPSTDPPSEEPSTDPPSEEPSTEPPSEEPSTDPPVITMAPVTTIIQVLPTTVFQASSVPSPMTKVDTTTPSIQTTVVPTTTTTPAIQTTVVPTTTTTPAIQTTVVPTTTTTPAIQTAVVPTTTTTPPMQTTVVPTTTLITTTIPTQSPTLPSPPSPAICNAGRNAAGDLLLICESDADIESITYELNGQLLGTVDGDTVTISDEFLNDGENSIELIITYINDSGSYIVILTYNVDRQPAPGKEREKDCDAIIIVEISMHIICPGIVLIESIETRLYTQAVYPPPTHIHIPTHTHIGIYPHTDISCFM